MVKSIILPVAGLLVCPMVFAADPEIEAFFQAGHTQRPSPGKSVNQYALGFGVDLPWTFDDGRVTTRLDSSLGYIDTKKGDVTQVTVQPVIRYQPSAIGYFVEAGLGASYVTKRRWSKGNDLGSNLHFASSIAGGYDFGKYTLALHLQHISNAGLDEPNDGANQIDVRLTWRF
jgi:hypothetical protein